MKKKEDKYKINKKDLVSTLHDPQGLFVPIISKRLTQLKEIYSNISIVATSRTSQATIDILKRNEISIELTDSGNIGESRRSSLSLGITKKYSPFCHYCDFDRILHWVDKYPHELEDLVYNKLGECDFLVIGRTIRAFNSHPRIQIETEFITNKFFSILIGENMDITAGSCAMSQKAIEFILSKSIEPTNATDAEWPMLIKFHAEPRLSFGYIEVEGLEFENPTFLGSEAYILSESLENYMNRIVLTKNSINSISRLNVNKIKKK